MSAVLIERVDTNPLGVSHGWIRFKTTDSLSFRVSRLDIAPNAVADLNARFLLRDRDANVGRFGGSRIVHRVGSGPAKQTEDGYNRYIDPAHPELGTVLVDEDETNA